MYTDVKSIILRYWITYGGWPAVIKSPYLHLSLIFLALTSHYWLTSPWWEQPLSIVPSLLGFSLGGLAMLLSFGNTRFQTFVSERDKGPDSDPSALMSVAASFVHFMLLQLLALLVAIIFNSLYFYVPWLDPIRPFLVLCNILFSAIGYFIFLYSILSMVAAVFAVFRMTSWFDVFQNSNKDRE